jgi:hypothetical protein
MPIALDDRRGIMADEKNDNYRLIATAAFQQMEDMRSKAFTMQGDYGKWLISSLFLMHGSAIAGLIFKSAGPDAPPFLFAVSWFVAGILFALGSGFLAWLNFTFAMQQYDKWATPNMLVNAEHWPKPATSKAVDRTLWTAVVSGFLSVACLIGGAVHVLCVWH